MKILEIKELVIPDIKIIKFGRFPDQRGYFSETFRRSDFHLFNFMKGFEFLQCNESFSHPYTVRGLHFQWNPYMGKLVRTIQGRMVDIVLDIRKKSPTYGKIIAYDMPAGPEKPDSEWIWVPPGFAHGNFFTEATTIQYFCTGEYHPSCEAGISPFAEDIDWSLCDKALASLFQNLKHGEHLISEKDLKGHSLASWNETHSSDFF